jgi:hypothetical protein
MLQTDQMLHDRQAETGSAGVPDTRRLHKIEPLEHASQIGVWDPGTSSCPVAGGGSSESCHDGDVQPGE